MWRSTSFTRALGVRLPIIGAPMAGGPSTPALVAAVSEAGGLGVLGGGYLQPGALRAAIEEVRHRTDRPFGVNLLVPEPVAVDPTRLAAGQAALQPFADEVGATVELPRQVQPDLAEQWAVVLAARPALPGFTFGIPPDDQLGAARTVGVRTCGTATTIAEAVALERAGVDMVCAQGGEAGGHRGGFLGDPADATIALTALVPLVRDAVTCPVVASGGIMDGRGVVAAIVLGADAAQLGTAFLLCPEAGTSEPYRKAVSAAGAADTVLTTAFSGKPARGIRNRMTTGLAGVELPPYPITNALTRDLRRRAAEQGSSEHLSLWAGQGVPLARELPAATLMAHLEQETDRAVAMLSSS